MEEIRANLKEAAARGRDPYLNAQQCEELVRLIDAASRSAAKGATWMRLSTADAASLERREFQVVEAIVDVERWGAATRQEACDWQLIAPSGEVRATERSCVLAWARIDGYKPTVENLRACEMNGWQVRPVPRGVAAHPATKESNDGR